MKKSEYQNEVVNRVRKLRLDNEISQIGLADIINVSNGQIGNIESPKFRQKYTLKQLYIISKHFNVNLSYLLTGNSEISDTDSIIQALIRYDE